MLCPVILCVNIAVHIGMYACERRMGEDLNCTFRKTQRLSRFHNPFYTSMCINSLLYLGHVRCHRKDATTIWRIQDDSPSVWFNHQAHRRSLLHTARHILRLKIRHVFSSIIGPARYLCFVFRILSARRIVEAQKNVTLQPH